MKFWQIIPIEQSAFSVERPGMRFHPIDLKRRLPFAVAKDSIEHRVCDEDVWKLPVSAESNECEAQ